MIVPQNLKENDKVAVVATAKRIEKDLNIAIEAIESWGFEVVLGKYVKQTNGYFAGTDEQKIEDLQWAIDDSSIKGVIFLRGGYGTTRILDTIDFSSLKENPKWFVGFSDLTGLLLQLENLGFSAVHGPMCSSIGTYAPNDHCLERLLKEQTSFEFHLNDAIPDHSASCEASITGGNLSLIYESIGSANEIQTDGKILFLEDVGEEMYTVDRMLNKLKRVGKLRGVKGLIIGSFTNINNHNNYFSETLHELVLSYFPQDIPKAVGLDAGHEEANMALLFGVDCKMTVDKNKLLLEYLKG